MKQFYYRWASSLGGGFEGTPEEVWGVLPYDQEKHVKESTVFCGLYGLPDFYALWRHKGNKYIWWCGSDIIHFVNGYWLNENGKIKIVSKPLAKWINENCKSWVENKDEAARLQKAGIKVKGICPSFLGNINKYEVSFKPGKKCYVSVSGDNFKMYGWDIIERIADALPWLEFYLYGNKELMTSRHKNVIIKGRVSTEQMNEEIKQMQIGLRLNEWDGFSEILAKAVLRGQYAIGKVKHPYIPSFKNDMDLILQLNKLRHKKEPNLKVRKWYLSNLNAYPWNEYAPNYEST